MKKENKESTTQKGEDIMNQGLKDIAGETPLHNNKETRDAIAESVSQQLIFGISQDGDKLKINLTFEPGIVGVENPEWQTMTDEQRAIQNYAGHIANRVIESLQQDQEEDDAPDEG